MEKTPQPMISKLRKIISDLGPLGVLAIAATLFISVTLVNGSGGWPLSNSSSGNPVEAHGYEEKIQQLFQLIDGVELKNVMIRFDETHSASSAIFGTSRTTEMVPSGLTAIYDGQLNRPYDVTQAISAITGIPFFEINLIPKMNLN